MNVGVVIMRAQPFHVGHIYVIKEMLKENDKVLVIIGSANKSGTVRNPLDIDFRLRMVRDALEDCGLLSEGLVSVMSLCDWSMETAYQLAKEWGSYLYYNVVNAIGQKTFSIYYNDEKSIVENWFVEELKPRVTIKNTPRGDINVSGTQIRDALLTGNDEYLRMALTPSVYEMREQIKSAILNAKDEDFMMQ